MLDPEGRIVSWNEGAQRIEGYSAEEIVGCHFSCFYPPEDVEAEKPSHELEIARREGSCKVEGWRVRKDGSLFLLTWCSPPCMTATARFAGSARLRAISANANRLKPCPEVQRHERRHAAQLEVANKELEAFSYSVSHDLRAPLREYRWFQPGADGGLCGAPGSHRQRLPEAHSRGHQRMSQLIDDLLSLARVTRGEMRHEAVDLGAMAKDIVADCSAKTRSGWSSL